LRKALRFALLAAIVVGLIGLGLVMADRGLARHPREIWAPVYEEQITVLPSASGDFALTGRPARLRVWTNQVPSLDGDGRLTISIRRERASAPSRWTSLGTVHLTSQRDHQVIDLADSLGSGAAGVFRMKFEGDLSCFVGVWEKRP
jgi:hypothetical protein